MNEIKKITKWRTNDGVEHSSVEMARQHLINRETLRVFERSADESFWTAQEILNAISANAAKIRRYLDACEAMEKASMR